MNPRMVLFEEDQKRLAEACEKLARDALAPFSFWTPTAEIVVATGEVASIDQTSLASLVAGTTAATTSLAKLLGEAEFPVHFHEGKHTHLHISLVGENHILTVVFDHRSSLGLVRLRVKRASELLLGLFEELARASLADKTRTSSARSPTRTLITSSVTASERPLSLRFGV